MTEADDWITPGQHPQSDAGANDWTVPESKPNSATSATTGSSMGKLEAGFHALLHGATFGWSDELAGIMSASGLPEAINSMPPDMQKPADEKLAKEGLGPTYREARDAERQTQKTAYEQHPGIYTAGDLAGSVAGAAAMPLGALGAAGRGVGIAGRAIQGAKIGAATGALSGAGDSEGGIGDTATGAFVGGGTGAAAGAIAGPLTSGAEWLGKQAYDYAGKPIVSVARGLINPEREAARRTAGAIERDIQSGRGGIDPAEYQAARAAGEPVALVDLGGTTTRALERSAANTSPEGRGALEDMTQSRFATQNERATDFIRGLVTTPANANQTREQLQAAAKVTQGPLYKKAFQDGQDIPFHEGFQQLLEAPAVRDAVRQATTTGANKAAAAGMKPVRNPFTFSDEGMPTLTNPSVRPSLQFWDQVKQNLDDKISTLMRSGEKKAASDIIQLKGALVQQLDEQVPSYAKARGVAASFFGANDALDAGEKALKWRGDPKVIAGTMAKMGPEERDLFREGYASSMADRLSALPDRNNVTTRLYESPQARKMAQVILGPDAAARMDAFVHRERIMDYARTALGNSSTARQLIEAGLAGGAAGAYLDPSDPIRGISEGVTAGALLRKGASKLVGHVDQKTAARVAELLSSDDPAKLASGVRMAARNQKVANALRAFDTHLAATASGRQAASRAGQLLPGTLPAAADQQQQQTP